MLYSEVKSGLEHETYTALLEAYPDALPRDQIGAKVSERLDETVSTDNVTTALTSLYFGGFVDRVPGIADHEPMVVYRAKAV